MFPLRTLESSGSILGSKTVNLKYVVVFFSLTKKVRDFNFKQIMIALFYKLAYQHLQLDAK